MKENTEDGFTIINDYSPQQTAEDARESITRLLKDHPNLTKEQIGHLTVTVAILRGLANV